MYTGIFIYLFIYIYIYRNLKLHLYLHVHFFTVRCGPMGRRNKLTNQDSVNIH